MKVEEFGTRITLPKMWWPLMELDDYTPNFCAVCGRKSPLNKHHAVPRSAGEVIDAKGHRMHKPLLTLCGFGNNLHDADGCFYCHGKAHQGLLFFRNNGGRFQFLDLTQLYTDPEPVSYLTALSMTGWVTL